MQLRISKLEHSDNLVELADLLSRVYVGEGHTPAEIAERVFTPERLAQSELILIAKSSSKIIGMICGASAKSNLRQVALSEELEIQNLVIDPKYRRSGIGNKLCNAIHDQAAELGYKKLVLATLPSMKSAHILYERLGYQRNPQRDWVKNNRKFLVFEKVLN